MAIAPVGAPPGAMGGPVPGGGPMAPQGGGMGGAHGPIGQTRNAIMNLVIGMICFVYLLYLIFTQVSELKAFRQKDDLNPIMFFIPILNLLQLWALPEKVLDAKQMAGVPNPSVQHPIMYLLLWPFFLTNDLNEIWQAAGGGAPQGY